VRNVIKLADFASVRQFGNLFADPHTHTHAVQFYEEESFLFDTVAQFIATGLKSNDRVVVIATKSHTAGFLQRVGTAAAEQAIDAGQLTLLDAEETLCRFMVEGLPDRDLFGAFLMRLMATTKDKRDVLSENAPRSRTSFEPASGARRRPVHGLRPAMPSRRCS
jgi:hypothetical protein